MKLPVIDPNDPFASYIKKLRRKFLRKYGQPIGWGRNREVYRDGDTVLKLPLSEYGEVDNTLEASRYKKWGNCGQYAACKIELHDDFPILRMEYVEPVTSSKGLPDWVDFIDGFQVGWTADGKLVAYDYGD